MEDKEGSLVNCSGRFRKRSIRQEQRKSPFFKFIRTKKKRSKRKRSNA